MCLLIQLQHQMPHETTAQEEEIQQFADSSSLDKKQIVALHARFTKLDKDADGFLSVEDFCDMPEIAVSPIIQVYANHMHQLGN